jgi:hypothetical protein
MRRRLLQRRGVEELQVVKDGRATRSQPAKDGDLMTTRELRHSQWAGYFDELSRTHRGTRASIETIGKDFGIFSNAINLPFMGITIERGGAERGDRSGARVIEVLLGGPSGPHVTHTIPAPSHVRVCEGDDPLAAVIQIEAAEGWTTLVYIGHGAQALAPGFIADDLIVASRVLSEAAAARTVR